MRYTSVDNLLQYKFWKPHPSMLKDDPVINIKY